MELSTIAVIRDTSTGACFLVPCTTHDEIDTERLEGNGQELAGWLQHAEQYATDSHKLFADTEDEADESGLTLYEGPQFTTCEHEGCGRLIAIIDDMAPVYCTEHEGEDEE